MATIEQNLNTLIQTKSDIKTKLQKFKVNPTNVFGSYDENLEDIYKLYCNYLSIHDRQPFAFPQIIDLPNDVTSLKPNTFYYNETIKKVNFTTEFQNPYYRLGNLCFQGCTKLEEVNFNNENDPKAFDFGTSTTGAPFRGCTRLHRLILQSDYASEDYDSVLQWGTTAFLNCGLDGTNNIFHLVLDVDLDYWQATLNALTTSATSFANYNDYGIYIRDANYDMYLDFFHANVQPYVKKLSTYDWNYQYPTYND